ncbi:016R [Cherax quadricarinatus iridovirus]|uniref:Uncharacterized protein n=1 Tax=Shrimp hemocyte iridescent virus TaxID=2039780 RepID=A0A291B0Y5_9VIRU|nr:016R [Cherax quadricarinatus iridovirus]YP_010084887.1 hypothetical protein KM509_gp135 [Shrimp hemocyte iridescent virus]UPA43336.1 hypothetical protein 4TH000062 [Iridovirus CN01]ASZ84996.1 016R [Cherax quadricarinatus iridovirus]ATE87144.1 hypothetical protein [Shrimp hemocyte iridescent virus]UPA43571.1 hypothetical protein 3TG000138 [Iridovirus CN01]UPA43606.1 hypothetical protein 1DG000014 [Iridovirus CN01]
MFNNCVLKAVFSDDTIEKLEMLDITLPTKLNFVGGEYYCISRNNIISSTAELQLTTSKIQYAKIVIFSCMFGIGKECVIEDDGTVIPFNSQPTQVFQIDDIFQEEYLLTMSRSHMDSIVSDYQLLLDYLCDNNMMDEFTKSELIFKLQTLANQCIDFENPQEPEEHEFQEDSGYEDNSHNEWW